MLTLTFGGVAAVVAATPQVSKAAGAPAISASKGGPDSGNTGCSDCYDLDISVSNFPTGTYTYYCHDNSGPNGSDTIFYHHTVAVTDPNQSSWPGVFCYDDAPYVAYLVMDNFTSNSVDFGAPPAGGGGGSTTTTTTSTPPPPQIKSVFFSPLKPAGGLAGVQVSDNDLSSSSWGVFQSCRAALAGATSLAHVPSTVSTLSGWSAGRQGPLLFLAGAGAARASGIHYIVLFDPGGIDSFGPCDDPFMRSHFHKSDSAVLAAWLKRSSANHLLILTGKISEAKRYHRFFGASFNGIKKYYFPDIVRSGASAIRRTLVCDYNDLKHTLVLKYFYGVVRYPPSGCPVSPHAARPRAFHP